ncbi:MAG: LemA family protein [Blastocatellia bacterium]|jgi:LemA protein
MGKTLLVVLGVIVLFVLILGGWAFGSYNNLIERRNLVDQQWAQVENNLQRRADLIPNIVNTVKGFANLEAGVLTSIAESRSRILSPNSTPEQKMDASNQMTSAARQAGLYGGGGGGVLGSGGRFLALTDQFPQLKSDQAFLRLQDELAGTENRLAVARKDYNESVTIYNTSRQKFPAVIIATMTGFQDKPFFKAEESARKAPEVKF